MHVLCVSVFLAKFLAVVFKLMLECSFPHHFCKLLGQLHMYVRAQSSRLGVAKYAYASVKSQYCQPSIHVGFPTTNGV